jgi:hypothetical protein
MPLRFPMKMEKSPQPAPAENDLDFWKLDRGSTEETHQAEFALK